ncbi:fimbrillin family protein [Parabacteroides sp.]
MKQVKNISLLLLSALAATSCSNEEIPNTPTPNSELVELGITAGVSLTKSAIHAESHDEFKNIAVFAGGDGYSSDYNSAIYTRSNNSWSNNTSDNSKRIMLNNKTATIYAIYPEKDGNDNAWSITPSADATISISTFLGNAQNTDGKSTITVPAASSVTTEENTPAEILSASGEVDYMYGVKDPTTIVPANEGSTSNQPTASNTSSEVAINMKHALAMVSFRIYNDGTYSGNGQLTEIKLSNASGSSGLNEGSSSTMNISSGAISVGSGSAATYTRVIKTDGTPGTAYYELGKVANADPSGAGSATAVKTAAAKFSILVFPLPSTETQADTDVKANTIQVTFKIDDVEHTVALGDENTKINWAAGTNSLYTAKLSGKELSITTVAVAEWGETPVGDSDLEVD